MYELKTNGKVFTSKFVGSVPSSYEKRIYRAAVSQRLRNTGLNQRKTAVYYSRTLAYINGRGLLKLDIVEAFL
jgi:hypothetical protein